MIAHFALRLLLGMSLMWNLLPRRKITSGFFRIQMLVGLGLSVLAALTVGQLIPPTEQGSSLLPTQMAVAGCGLLAVVTFFGSILWTLERRRGGTVCAVLVSLLSAAVLLGSVPLPYGSTGLLAVFSEVSASALLGTAVTGMLLGHWYLTAPTMSTEPLGRANFYFGLAAGIRALTATVGILWAWNDFAGPTDWTWLTLRILGGLLGPVVAAVLVWRILRYRNTQSATGVLFAGVILVFLGELAATLLTRELQVPI